MLPKKLDGLKIANEIAFDRGGKCLSNEYLGIFNKMLWVCGLGHQWEAALHKVKNHKSWCHKCAGNEKLSIEIAQKIAKEQEGECLSDRYINNITKMLWKCKENHIWYAPLNNIKSGHWCRKCADNINAINYRMKDGLDIAKQIAEYKDGRCLSTEYINNHTKMKWRCGCGYVWYSTLANIKNNNRWCPECAQLKRAISSNKSYTLSHWKTGEELICTASYEKAVVEYLNVNQINFKWQPRSFTMPSGRKYYPDMYLLSTKKWIEIKGYFWGDARKKWDWFQTIKPNSELWDKNVLKSMGIL